MAKKNNAVERAREQFEDVLSAFITEGTENYFVGEDYVDMTLDDTNLRLYDDGTYTFGE